MMSVLGCFSCEWGVPPTLDDDVALCLRHWREAESWANSGQAITSSELEDLDREALAIARNIVNQIGDFYYERIPSPDWVKVRQATNDDLDAFAARLISGIRRTATGEPPADRVDAAARALNPEAWKAYDNPAVENRDLLVEHSRLQARAALRAGGGY